LTGGAGSGDFFFHRAGEHRALGLVEVEVAVADEAGAGGDEMPHDDVFLEAAQVVGLRERGGLGEHTGGVLEGGGGDEALGLDGGLGDAEEDGLCFRRLAAFFGDALVFLLETPRSIWSPQRNSVSPVSVTFTLRSI
jgi:hypothetical protein